MSVIKFKKETSGVTILTDDMPTAITSGVVIKPFGNTGFRVLAPGYDHLFTLEGNTFFINDVEQEDPVLATMISSLRSSVFLSTNSGSGGSGGGAATALKLTAPDSTVYEVTVNNAGALVTTVSTAGGSAATSLILTAPNSTQYEVTVNNDGALITTAI